MLRDYWRVMRLHSNARIDRSHWRRVVFFFILHFVFRQFLYVQDDAASRRFFLTLSKIVSREHRNDATIAQKIPCEQSHVYIKRWIYIFRYNLIYVKGFYLTYKTID